MYEHESKSERGKHVYDTEKSITNCLTLNQCLSHIQCLINVRLYTYEVLQFRSIESGIRLSRAECQLYLLLTL